MPLYALGDDEPVIDPTAYVHPEAVIIGKVTLGTEASVWPNAVLRGDDGRIVVGARSNVQDGAVIHCTDTLDTIIGEDCTIGHLAHLEGCIVHDRSLIGTASVVLHKAEIGPHALVGANATVTGGTIVPPEAMALGTPAKVRENALKPNQNLLNADIYVQRAHHYRTSLRPLTPLQP